MDTKQGQAEEGSIAKEMGVVAPDQVVTPAPVVDLAAVGKVLDQRIALVERVHTMIQSRINPETDIKKVGANFRRTINFARKCFRIIGGEIRWWRDPETDLRYRREEYEDEKGRFYIYTVACVWRTPWGDEVEAFKAISSREPFFGITDGDFIPTAEVNVTDILEMAVTEAFKSAIFTGLGLPKDVAAGDLKKFGVDGGKATGHTFNGAKGAQGGNQDTNQEDYDARKEIESLCKALCEGAWSPDGKEYPTAEAVLQRFTANPPTWDGWKSFRAIKPAQLGKIRDALKQECAKVGALPDSHLPVE